MSGPLSIGKFLRVHPEEDGYRELENKRGEHMGWIKWHAPWRCFELITHDDQRGWTSECLRDVARHLDAITAERRGKTPAVCRPKETRDGEEKEEANEVRSGAAGNRAPVAPSHSQGGLFGETAPPVDPDEPDFRRGR